MSKVYGYSVVDTLEQMYAKGSELHRQTIRKYCELQGVVSHAWGNYDHANDCFCEEGVDPHKHIYRNSWHSLHYIERVVRFTLPLLRLFGRWARFKRRVRRAWEELWNL